jgi:hypothetical protein
MPIAMTAIFGGYERPKAPPPGVTRAVMVTDTIEDRRWEIMRRPDHGVSRFRAYFVTKLVPHTLVDDDDVLWLDSSFEPKEGCDVERLFRAVPPGGVGLYAHAIWYGQMGRSNYVEEAEFAHADERYRDAERGRLARYQAAHYMARVGLVPGLWSAGIIVWRGAQKTLGARWFAEVMTWSSSDQIALPYAAHVTGTRVTTLPGNIYENPDFAYVEHGKEGRTTLPNSTLANSSAEE